MLVVALVAVVRLIAHGQSSTDSQPQFEVASIKLNRSEGPANYWEISGRRFLGNRSQVSELIRLAWGDFQLRIEGAPDWIGRDRYDVIANAGVDIAPDAPVLGQMMRELLLERFKLAAHKEPRTGLMDGYQVDLEFVPQRLQAAPPTPDQPPPPAPEGQTVFDALQEQLGLKLESKSGSVDVLVVDRIERPTPD